MANLADKSGDAYSNLVSGDGTNSATFTMPGTVPLAVESVVATVDNGAGGDTTAILVVRDPSGQVIATKRQGQTVDAGASGTATWALRLDDELQSFAAGGAEFVASPAVESIAASTTTNLAWSHASGATWLDYSTPQVPRFLHGGIYAVTVYVRAQGPTPTTLSWTCSLTVGTASPVGAIPIASNVWGTNANPQNSWIALASTQGVPAGDLAIVSVANPAGATRDFELAGVVQRLK